MGTEIQKKDLSVTFLSAVSNQMKVLTTSTGKTENEIKSLLISFAYATKQMLEASKQSMTNIDPMSIKEAFKNMLDTGVPVDKRQLAYVIKYGNQIEYKIGYKGFISRIKEIYPTAQVKAELVYKGDIFNVENVDGKAKYTHKVANPFADIKDLAGAYAYVQYVDKGKEFAFIETMGTNEINKIKGKATTKMVWNEWYGEMAKKAVIRRLCKTLFIGDPKIQAMEEVDNKNFEIQKPLNVDYDKTIPMPEEVQENKAEIEETPKEEKPKEVEETQVEEKKETQTEEDAMSNIFKLQTFTQKEFTSQKTRKLLTLTTLYLEGGISVKTYDKKDYVEGQTIELIDWDKEKGSCKKVNIL